MGIYVKRLVVSLSTLVFRTLHSGHEVKDKQCCLLRESPYETRAVLIDALQRSAAREGQSKQLD